MAEESKQGNALNKTKTVSRAGVSDSETVFCLYETDTMSAAGHLLLVSAFAAGFFPTEKHTQKITARSSTANAIQPISVPVPFPANIS